MNQIQNYAVLALIIALFSCSNEQKDTRSMAQIYSEEGVPVSVREVQEQQFVVKKSYNAALTGIEESSAYASIGDKVEQVFVNVGDYVEKDQKLLSFPTNSPSAQYFQAKIGYENAKLNYDRIANLYQTGGISKQQLDNAKAGLEVAAANWDAAQQSVIVKAPISGYVTKVNVRESDNVKKEAELFTISRMNKMKARVWISEKDAPDVVRGLSAMAVWNGIELEGKVVEVDMALNQMRQAFGAAIEFENPGKIVKFGVTVDVFIETYRNPQAIVVQANDLVRENDNYYIYVVNEGKAEKRSVKTGKRYELDVEITDGLNPGDTIVIEGQMLLSPQAKVKIIN